MYLLPSNLPLPSRTHLTTKHPPIPLNLLATTLHLANLCCTVLPEATPLAETPLPTRWHHLLELTASFHEAVATRLFPHDPDHLIPYSRDAFDHLDLSLTYIAPVPVGVPCHHCELPAPGDLIHLLDTLDALSRPHPLEARKLQETWQTCYPDWHLPYGFHLETICLHLEDHPLPAPYTALPDVIRHALGYSGNWFLDACPHCWNEETEAWYWPSDETSMEDVRTLTHLWEEARPRWQAIQAFHDWLSDEPLRRREQIFTLLLNTHHAMRATTLPLPL